MKKIIRLTESELERIIKKVISEAPLGTYTPPNLAATAASKAPKAASIPTNISTEKKPVPAPVPKTIFGIGDKGPEILAFQKHLAALGYNVGKNGPDGIFGPATEAAVKEFQAKYGIKVSGRVGPPTKGKLATVASAPKPTYDPSAEWNQDRREEGDMPSQTTQAAKAPTAQAGKKTDWGLSPLVADSPGAKAIASIGPNIRAAREKAKKDKAARQEYYKAHPELGYGGGGIFGSKK